MNRRIGFKLNNESHRGMITSIFYNMLTKDIVNRFWAMIKMFKKLHQLSSGYVMKNGMTIFSDGIFNKNTTKRDVNKYVKTVKSHFHPSLIIFKPRYVQNNYHTWTELIFSHHDDSFINRWYKSLNTVEKLSLSYLAVGVTFKQYQRFLKRVKANFTKNRKRVHSTGK